MRCATRYRCRLGEPVRHGGERGKRRWRPVTAPTNGAAGVIPAVLYTCAVSARCERCGIATFLLTAGAIEIIYKVNASLGCRGGLPGRAWWHAPCRGCAGVGGVGGTPEQVENAAEIGMEHNLGMTRPRGWAGNRIERNAMGAIKAINAACMALQAAMASMWCRSTRSSKP